MKLLILLTVALASVSGRPGVVYSNINSWPLGTTTHYTSGPVTYSAVASPVTYTAAAPVTYSAVASPVTYTAAAPVTYSAVASPVTYSTLAAPVTYTATAPVVVSAPLTTQYHAQDELGQASFGYSHPGQARAEVRDAFGGVRGSYAYINAEGKEVITNYVADDNGFRVASNNLPIAPAVPVVAPLVGPAPVQDTPEVAAAKADHAKAVADAIARNAEADKVDAANKIEEKVEEKAGENKEASQAVAVPAKEGDGEVITAPVNVRRKRSPGFIAAPVAAPVVTYSVAAPAITYSAPTVHYPAATLTYATAPATTVLAAAPAAWVRSATLTKVHTPHSVTYRVD